MMSARPRVREKPKKADVKLLLPEMETLQEGMEAVAETIQGEIEYENEDALEVFEAYREIKKRMQEKKINRGFKDGGAFIKGGRRHWNLSGTINTKIQQFKSKTLGRICKKTRY